MLQQPDVILEAITEEMPVAMHIEGGTITIKLIASLEIVLNQCMLPQCFEYIACVLFNVSCLSQIHYIYKIKEQLNYIPLR